MFFFLANRVEGVIYSITYSIASQFPPQTEVLVQKKKTWQTRVPSPYQTLHPPPPPATCNRKPRSSDTGSHQSRILRGAAPFYF